MNEDEKLVKKIWKVLVKDYDWFDDMENFQQQAPVIHLSIQETRKQDFKGATLNKEDVLKIVNKCSKNLLVSSTRMCIIKKLGLDKDD